ncbi:SMR family transporter [Kocuria sp.]|uniref:DMT family transporter n=1 Tax=Kocuria sp. TaxID=1871328 RepID=UPI003451220D
MAWLFLAGAALLEVTATLSIKAALEQPALYAVVVLGYAGAFTCLTLVLRRGMPLGVAYGIWAAAGLLLVELEASH